MKINLLSSQPQASEGVEGESGITSDNLISEEGNAQLPLNYCQPWITGWPSLCPPSIA